MVASFVMYVRERCIQGVAGMQMNDRTRPLKISNEYHKEGAKFVDRKV